MKISIPELSLVVLVGTSGSGKSTFASKHFLPTEVISSDFCRGLVSDNENDQTATSDAFDILHYIAAKRLKNYKLTAIDATNVQREDRKGLVELAREHHCLPVAIVLNLPMEVCKERNEGRQDREFGVHVIRRQNKALKRSLRGLKKEGFRYVYVLNSVEEIDAVEMERTRLWTNKQDEHGPFDIIGDVHGCFDELEELLQQIGYEVKTDSSEGSLGYKVIPPEGRKAVFLGDLVDRGPKNPEVLRLVMGMVEAGDAICIPGNHDNKLLRKLRGRNVQLTHGLAETVQQLENEPDEYKQRLEKFLDSLISHYVLDDGNLVVAHAGMKASMQGRASRKVRDFAMYGETTGETDEFGLPIRYNWASEYRGKSIVVYGHTPIPEPEWINNTINIDTGCVFGGKLTALRYPEKELVSVPARQTYAEPMRKFLEEEDQAPGAAPHRRDYLLDINDVLGKRYIQTRLGRTITIREENAIAAMEVMSRFAVDPRWLIYLPPTMSPSETSKREGMLEYPSEAFAYFRGHAVPKIICEEKHMGSRVMVVVCKDGTVAKKRFGIPEDSIGICYTRTGRRFFDDGNLERSLLERLQQAISKSNLWEKLNTDWLLLDCELMPWSAKAQGLLSSQYAAVGSAGKAALEQVVQTLERAQANGTDVSQLLEKSKSRADAIKKYAQAFRQYAWPVESLNDLKLAPFHILASEGAVHIDKDHLWHIETIKSVCDEDKELLCATDYKVIDLTDSTSQDEGVAWWESLTGNGGEGMVIKPLDFTVTGKKGLIQPAVKCRGPEYLRIIYGPEYTFPEHLERLRSRGLGRKRSLAIREFALGIEAMERFVRQEPLYRVHECVFGILALESSPVDPRL